MDPADLPGQTGAPGSDDALCRKCARPHRPPLAGLTAGWWVRCGTETKPKGRRKWATLAPKLPDQLLQTTTFSREDAIWVCDSCRGQ